MSVTPPPLRAEHLRPRLDVAADIARRAGHLALRMQQGGRGALDVRHKPGDQGPVTAADEAAERLIMEALARAFPTDLRLGEETGQSSDASPAASGPLPLTWMIDPIDGTRDFARGSGDWAVHLGLALRGSPVLGVVYQPSRDRLTAASRLPEQPGALYAPEPAAVSSATRDGDDASRYRIVTSLPGRSARTDHLAALLQIPATRHHSVGSTGVKLSMLVWDEADIYLYAEGKTRVWDTCAPTVPLLAAGGVITDLRGIPLQHDDADRPHARGILAGRTPQAHAWALERLKRAG